MNEIICLSCLKNEEWKVKSESDNIYFEASLFRSPRDEIWFIGDPCQKKSFSKIVTGNQTFVLENVVTKE